MALFMNRGPASWLHCMMATTALTTATFAGGAAFAQTSATPASTAQAEPAPAAVDGQAEPQEGEIVVTASRTATNGLQAPTPTQVLGADVIEKQGATTVMEVLNQNPAFKATRSPGADAAAKSRAQVDRMAEMRLHGAPHRLLRQQL